MSNQPLYAGLAAEFIRDIREGRYPVGSFLPTETDLAAQRKLSRATVRSAFNSLVSLGLVSRRKGIGTKVEAVSPSTSYNPAATTIEDLVQFNAATDRRVQSIEKLTADDRLAKRLNCRPGHRWVRISTTRREPSDGAVPICWTDIYLDERYEGVVEHIAHAEDLVIDLVCRAYGVAVDEIRQSIRATGVPKDIATALLCEPGDHALEITRHYLEARRASPLVTITVHPSDRFVYTTSLKRPRNAQ